MRGPKFKVQTDARKVCKGDPKGGRTIKMERSSGTKQEDFYLYFSRPRGC